MWYHCISLILFNGKISFGDLYPSDRTSESSRTVILELTPRDFGVLANKKTKTTVLKGIKHNQQLIPTLPCGEPMPEVPVLSTVSGIDLYRENKGKDGESCH